MAEVMFIISVSTVNIQINLFCSVRFVLDMQHVKPSIVPHVQLKSYEAIIEIMLAT